MFGVIAIKLMSIAGTKLDSEYLSGFTDVGNQALKTLREIQTIQSFWSTCEKFGNGFQIHHRGARCPAYRLGTVRLSVQPNRCTLVQRRADNLIENKWQSSFGHMEERFLCFLVVYNISATPLGLGHWVLVGL